MEVFVVPVWKLVLVMDEVNDMLKKNKIKINYQYNDENEEGWDYFLELDKEDICQ